jgi:hypothetical protein
MPFMRHGAARRPPWKERLRLNPNEYAEWLEKYQRRQVQLAARSSGR